MKMPDFNIKVALDSACQVDSDIHMDLVIAINDVLVKHNLECIKDAKEITLTLKVGAIPSLMTVKDLLEQ